MAKLIEDACTLALVGASVSNVNVSLLLDPRLPLVLVSRIQIQLVLLNLMRNALEAMAQRAAGNDEPPSRRELTVTATGSGYDMVEVEVADTGPGLVPEIADRLYNSFVSMKPGGMGMGMGLSICRSLVDAHGGRLWVEPNSGAGAMFRFTLQSPLQAVAS